MAEGSRDSLVMFMPILPGLECFLLYLLLATRLHLIFGTHSLIPTASFITDLDATVTGGSGCAILSWTSLSFLFGVHVKLGLRLMRLYHVDPCCTPVTPSYPKYHSPLAAAAASYLRCRDPRSSRSFFKCRRGQSQRTNRRHLGFFKTGRPG